LHFFIIIKVDEDRNTKISKKKMLSGEKVVWATINSGIKPRALVYQVPEKRRKKKKSLTCRNQISL